MREIYLDNAAATPVDSRVAQEMQRVFSIYGNPSSYNDAGRRAAQELEQARLMVARFLGAHQNEIVFTSSGSEANALAIKGVWDAYGKKGSGIIATPIEHLSVLEWARAFKSKTVYANVSKEGLVDLKDIEKKIQSNTLLISIMYANNEIGTIQPIIPIGKMIQAYRRRNDTKFPLFHVDACQATEYLNMNVNSLSVDLFSFNGSKIYGPRGIGVLYVRRGIKIESLILGGGQEYGLRAGTENLPAIVGLAKAVSIIDKKERIRLAGLRDYFLTEIQKSMPDIKINGPMGQNRLPNNINISVPNLDSENLLLELDRHGIRAGSGSACTARSVQVSHVLKAVGTKKPYLGGALRFSLGHETTRKDIEYLLKVLPKIAGDLRDRYGV